MGKFGSVPIVASYPPLSRVEEVGEVDEDILDKRGVKQRHCSQSAIVVRIAAATAEFFILVRVGK